MGNELFGHFACETRILTMLIEIYGVLYGSFMILFNGLVSMEWNMANSCFWQIEIASFFNVKKFCHFSFTLRLNSSIDCNTFLVRSVYVVTSCAYASYTKST